MALKKILRYLSFALTVAILVGVLKLINWVPMAAQQGIIRPYSSLDDVKLKLRIKEIYVPHYFPQRLTWPPSVIVAQGKPYFAITMEFRRADKGDTALTISQAESVEYAPEQKIRFLEVKERVSYMLKGRHAKLEVGRCERDEICSRIAWHEGKYKIMIAIKSTPFELIRLAESMLP